MTREEIEKKMLQATSAEEIIAIVKEAGGKELTKEEAQEVYDKIHNTEELSDDAMENVAGGMSEEEMRLKGSIFGIKFDFEIPGI